MPEHFTWNWTKFKKSYYMTKKKKINKIKPKTKGIFNETYLLYSHLLIHPEIYIYIYWIHTDAMNNRRRKTSLTKYLPLTLLQGFEKGYSTFACERELEIEHNCNILTPTLMADNVVSFSFSWCSTRGPRVHSAGGWLSLLHLISIFSGPQLIRAPSPFGLVWLSLPHITLSVSNSLQLAVELNCCLDCVI